MIKLRNNTYLTVNKKKILPVMLIRDLLWGEAIIITRNEQGH